MYAYKEKYRQVLNLTPQPIFETCYTLSMKLSPLDIQHQEFDSAMSGYKKKQVREFLERVADTFEDLLHDNQSLRDELSEQKDKVEALQVGEIELRRAMVSAERIGNEMKEQAQREAELVLQQARAEKETILRSAETRLEEVETELARTEREHKLFREQFRGMLRAYERSLDSQPEPPQRASKLKREPEPQEEVWREPQQEFQERAHEPQELPQQEGSPTPQQERRRSSLEESLEQRPFGTTIILEPDD